jgi:catechol 2,3-dioxygenase-like lactoylglutathione lyase family enzyme
MPMLRRRACAVLVAAVLAPTILLSAQLGAPNAVGVSIGHVHLTVRNPEEHKKIWLLLGAQVTTAGPLELLKFPGVFVILTKGEPVGGSEGSTVNHFGFMVRSVDEVKAKLTAVGLPTVQEITNPKRWVTMLPDAVKVEFTEEPSLKAAIIGHHLHLSTNDLEPLRAWYVKTFGGVAETRRGFPSAVFEGGEINVIQAPERQAPTKGRSIDHIGFEVKGLEAFCKKLQAEGVTFEVPYREVPQLGLKLAFIVDPVGTRIELTEGLAGR